MKASRCPAAKAENSGAALVWASNPRRSFFLLDFTYVFFERGEGREKEKGRNTDGREGGRETSMCEKYIHQLPLTCPQQGTQNAIQTCALTGN